MTDKSILFSGPMIRAILEGRKTQTRRIAKPDWKEGANREFSDWRAERISDRLWFLKCTNLGATIRTQYSPGDRLWVREAHYLTDDGESEFAVFSEDEGAVSEHLEQMQTTMASHPNINWSKHLRLRPSIHMPRWASRLTLTVTDVRVQRLQDVNEPDAMAEGMTFPDGMAWGNDPIDAFKNLWDSLNAERGFGWNENPWVAAYTFTVHKCNIDQMGSAA